MPKKPWGPGPFLVVRFNPAYGPPNQSSESQLFPAVLVLPLGKAVYFLAQAPLQRAKPLVAACGRTIAECKNQRVGGMGRDEVEISLLPCFQYFFKGI